MDTATGIDELRKQRGLAILRNSGKRIRHIVGQSFFVPSETGDGGYAVDTEKGTCTCEDFESTGRRCKHFWAAVMARDGVGVPEGEGSKIRRVTYSQDWPAYNRAQVEEKEKVKILLRDLCNGIVLPMRKLAADR